MRRACRDETRRMAANIARSGELLTRALDTGTPFAPSVCRVLAQQQCFMRNALIALLLASTLGACAAQKGPEATVPTPPPPVKWYKEGASAEEFKRTRAKCTMNASTAGTMADPSSVFRSCMRSQGWVQK
jgi:hypothetical protein